MLDGRRSTIEELKVKQKIVPSFGKTVYVEGSTDKALIRWFLQLSQLDDISVLNIQSVEIPKDKIDEQDLEDNHRSRVIVITILLENVIGIIDSDFDFLTQEIFAYKDSVCLTDYSSMEMYCYNKEILDKILMPYGKASQDFLKSADILVELFLIAYAKKILKNELSKPKFVKNITIESGTIKFDKKSYLKKYTDDIELIKEFNQFMEKIKLPKDKRKSINGHDFVSLLQFYLDIKQRDAKLTFEKSLYSALEYDMLKKEEMFKKLLLLLKETSHA